MIKKTMRNLTALDVPGFAPEDTLLDADGMVYTGSVSYTHLTLPTTPYV